MEKHIDFMREREAEGGDDRLTAQQRKTEKEGEVSGGGGVRGRQKD